MAGNFYKVFVQLVLLYGSETWAVMGRVVVALEWLHRGVEQRIAKRRAAFDGATGTGSHPPTAEVLEVTGLLPLGEYLEKRQSGVANYIDTCPILGLCLEALRPEGGAGESAVVVAARNQEGRWRAARGGGG